jgi:non-heme chloroperoxidase
MGFIRAKDGTEIYYKDWGSGQPVVLSHGWPLCSDSWESQMFFLASNGYRCIACDRRGHGRSSQPWEGNNMDTFADDIANLIDTLDLKNIALIGFSMGGGDITRYIGRYGTMRVAKLGLISAVTPLMAATPGHPTGVPIEVFDKTRTSLVANRAQFYKEFASGPFFGYNRPGSEFSQGVVDSFWMQGMISGFKNSYDCIKAFSETDFTEDLRKVNVPTLIVHGTDDQVVPIDVSGRVTAKIIKDAKFIEYTGAPHGLCETHKDRLNKDLLAFIRE